jgi:hypothetical protein
MASASRESAQTSRADGHSAAEQIRENPAADRSQLINQAGQRFGLSPSLVIGLQRVRLHLELLVRARFTPPAALWLHHPRAHGLADRTSSLPG